MRSIALIALATMTLACAPEPDLSLDKDYNTGFFFELRYNRIVNVTDKVFGP